MEFFSFWFFLAVGAASLFGMISVAAWAESRRAEREALYNHEMMKKIAEQPPEAAERVMQFLREEQVRAEERKRANARYGLRLG